MACICPVDDDGVGLCLGIPGESDECGDCLELDPEAPCLRDLEP